MQKKRNKKISEHTDKVGRRLAKPGVFFGGKEKEKEVRECRDDLYSRKIQHIRTNPKNGGVLIDGKRFCVAGRGAAGFGKGVEL